MARLLGDNLLPDSVVSRRRQVRQKISDLRQPIRQFRERNVPGPDLVGSAEEQFMNLRNKLVSRDSVMSRIRSRNGTNNSEDASGSGGNGERSKANQMT